MFSLLCIPLLSDYKSQPVHQSLMFPVALHDIDSRRVDARMPQQIGQLRDIPVEAVEGSGKQMPEIVGKDFFCLHSRGAAQAFHLRPDIGTVHGISVFRHEDRSRGDTRLPAVSAQRPAELFRQKDDPLFSLAVHLRPARFQGLHRDEAQFGDADAGGADRLKNEVKCTPCQGQIKKKGFLFFNQQISILLYFTISFLFPFFRRISSFDWIFTCCDVLIIFVRCELG